MLTFAERLAELAAVLIDAGVYVKAGLLTVVYWGNLLGDRPGSTAGPGRGDADNLTPQAIGDSGVPTRGHFAPEPGAWVPPIP